MFPTGLLRSIHMLTIPWVRVLGLLRWSSQAPLPLRSLRRLQVPLRPPPHLLFRLSLLRVMGIHLPNRQPLVGFLWALLPLAQLVTPARRRSRRPVMRRAMSPSETPPRLVWSARTHVHCRTPRCGFEAWFGQPDSTASRQRLQLYPRFAEVELEVVARAEALARRAKPLSHVIPARSRRYAIADEPLFASSLPVNPSFAQLVGARSVGSKRWEKEMERVERLFWTQLEMTSSSLWLMSGILAMLKRDGFQPSDPTLFNAALSSVSASLSQQVRSSSAGASFVRSKHRESLLMHTSIPVPEAQRRSLTAPGSTTGLFNEDIFSEGRCPGPTFLPYLF